MKTIKTWEDLNGLENERGLYLEAYIRGNTKSHCECYIFDGINNLNLGIYPTNNLEEIIYTLKKYGFDIEYGKPFNLVDFLEENLEPFAYEDERRMYIINLPTEGFVYLVSTVNLNPLSCMFFGIISQNYDKDGINDILLENEIDSQQLIDAMEEIGWV